MEGYGFGRNGGRPHRQQHGGRIGFRRLLFGALKYGGSKIQDGLRAPTEVINIMMGTIVFFIAVPRLVRILRRFRGKGGPR
jgi:simple sugar transport system permease protein